MFGFFLLVGGLHMRQIAGLGISTQRGTFITWDKYVYCVLFKMNLCSWTVWKQAVERNVELSEVTT